MVHGRFGTSSGMKERKSRHIRRVLKWMGVGACGIVLVSWGLSTWSWFGYSNLYWEIWFAEGTFNFIDVVGYYGITLDAGHGWFWEVYEDDLAEFGFEAPSLGGGDWLRLPLWLPFAVAAAPTLILFYRDRRRPPPGHCKKCGYDLAGNVSGRCPECGVALNRLKGKYDGGR